VFSVFRYFHRAPRPSHDASRSFTSLTSYRSGSRKGLDLTMGGPFPPSISRELSQSARSDKAEQEKDNQNEGAGRLRGGILLRSLREVPKNTNSSFGKPKAKMVSGPSLLVDKILELSGASSISNLVEELWGGDTAAFIPRSSSRKSHLYFRQTTDTPSKLPQIHKSPRIGLDLSHSGTKVPNSQTKFTDLHPRIRFLPKMYRYMIKPDQLSKGRGQTFYGCLHATLGAQFDIPDRNLSGDRKSRALLASSVGIKDDMVKKYLSEYKTGREGGLKRLQRCIGPNGKGMAVSPASYLGMMGALDAVVANTSKIEISTEGT
jgi:hypothetical protein